MTNHLDLIGQTFNYWTVLEKVGKNKEGRTLWLCKCKCGNIKEVLEKSLINNHSKSCGCLQKEKATKHSLSRSRIYKVWYGMKNRCFLPTFKNYKYYGGRGITVCDEWKNDFMTFYEWAMANGYNPNAKKGECTLDRINNNGNYQPDNCRWIDIKKQCQNTRRNHNITINNETHCISEWARIYGINKERIIERIKNGWDEVRAVTTPVRKYDIIKLT